MVSSFIKILNLLLMVYQTSLMLEYDMNLIIMIINLTLSVLILIFDSGKDKLSNLL